MPETNIVQLIVQVVTVAVAVAGVAWKVGGALRTISSHLDVLGTRLEHVLQTQATLARAQDQAAEALRLGLEDAKRGRAELWGEMRELRDRLTKVETREEMRHDAQFGRRGGEKG